MYSSNVPWNNWDCHHEGKETLWNSLGQVERNHPPRQELSFWRTCLHHTVCSWRSIGCNLSILSRSKVIWHSTLGKGYMAYIAGERNWTPTKKNGQCTRNLQNKASGGSPGDPRLPTSTALIYRNPSKQWHKCFWRTTGLSICFSGGLFQETKI